MATTLILPPASALEAACAELMRGADVKRSVTLNKGLYDLITQDEARIIRVSGGYLIPSTSRSGIVHRADDVNGCSCEAGRSGHFCRHIAAIELIEHAQRHTMPALPMGTRIARARNASYAEALAEINELF